MISNPLHMQSYNNSNFFFILNYNEDLRSCRSEEACCPGVHFEIDVNLAALYIQEIIPWELLKWE